MPPSLLPPSVHAHSLHQPQLQAYSLTAPALEEARHLLSSWGAQQADEKEVLTAAPPSLSLPFPLFLLLLCKFCYYLLNIHHVPGTRLNTWHVLPCGILKLPTGKSYYTCCPERLSHLPEATEVANGKARHQT